MIRDFEFTFMDDIEEVATRRFANAVKNETRQYLSKFNLHLKSESFFKMGNDSHYELKYIGLVGVIFTYYLFDSTIGVAIVQLSNGELPEKYSFMKKKNYFPAITLSALIEYKLNKKFDDPLPNPGPFANSIKSTLLKRQSILKDRLEEIVKFYISNLAVYANDLLCGDTAFFLPVQEQYTSKVKREYSWFK